MILTIAEKTKLKRHLLRIFKGQKRSTITLRGHIKLSFIAKDNIINVSYKLIDIEPQEMELYNQYIKQINNYLDTIMAKLKGLKEIL